MQRLGVSRAWSARCFLHTSGDVCNKTLTWGRDISPDEAKHRIMQWCIDGVRVPNDASGRDLHMVQDPRVIAVGSLLPVQELERVANAV